MNRIFQIDTTNNCNLDCVFCFRDRRCSVKFINLNDIKTIISNLSDYSGISIVNEGEFFCHPQWEDILELIYSCDSIQNKYVTLTSNGTLFDEKNQLIFIKKILKYKIKTRITISINAATSITYKKITSSQLFENLINNVKNLFINYVEIDELKNYLSLSVQFLVIPENSHEIRGFLEFWQNYLDNINIDYDICEDKYKSEKNVQIALRRYFSGNYIDSELFDEEVKRFDNDINIKLSDNIEKGKDFYRRKACRYLFLNPSINNEWVTICCRDSKFDYKYKKIGDLENDKEKKFKAYHVEGMFEQIGLCRNCHNYEIMEADEIKNYFNSKIPYEMYLNRLEKGVCFDFYNISFEENCISDVDFYFSKNKLTSLFSTNKDFKNAFYHGFYNDKKKGEFDFCVQWLRNASFKDGFLYTGCDECQIKIEKFHLFREKLLNNDYSDIPDKCYYCENKFSYDKLRDRYYTFGSSNINSPALFSREFSDKKRLIENAIREGNISQACSISKEIDRIEYYRDVFNQCLKFGYDDRDIFDMVCETKNIFFYYEYSLFTEKFFPEILFKIMESNNKRILPVKVNIKLVRYYAEGNIEDIDIRIYLENVFERLLKGKIIYNSDLDRELYRSICFHIVDKIEEIEEYRDIIMFFAEWSDFLDLKEIKEALFYKIVNISQTWNFYTFYKVLDKFNMNVGEESEKIIHYRLVKLLKYQGFEQYLKNIYTFSLQNVFDISPTVHNSLMEIYKNKDYVYLLKLIEKFRLFSIKDVDIMLGNVIYDLFVEKKYSTIFKFFRRNIEIITNWNELKKNILEYDFSLYNLRYLRL
ncbi:MAG: radical SAM protein, partial [Candidatus Muirbacterium halophilum]|nr:radical SAM protein [Candidatus Muirbacterium halophilum]